MNSYKELDGQPRCNELLDPGYCKPSVVSELKDYFSNGAPQSHMVPLGTRQHFECPGGGGRHFLLPAVPEVILSTVAPSDCVGNDSCGGGAQALLPATPTVILGVLVGSEAN